MIKTIKLVDISKYYHDENSVVMGLRKVNLEFKLGEFIAITGESGCGKSTLLNVISGVDTYEEGEMYIDGEETSYYSNDDWERYRSETVGFIFQNYNLIDSYTVLENVCAPMIIQGIKRKEYLKRAKEIINRVGLGNYLHQKSTKLSGGQKQRLAIARALAKNTDIIVADEPTGNLDSESGKQIIELLKEISKDKLVIIVTHNYEEVSSSVTRKIRLFDGEVAEDREIKPIVVNEVLENEDNTKTSNSFFVKSFKFALLNLKNQPKRTILLLTITFMMSLFVLFFFIMFSISNDVISIIKPSGVFANNYEERVVAAKKDKTVLTKADIKALSEINNVISVNQYDIMIDYFISGDDGELNGNMNQCSLIDEDDLVVGKMPEDFFDVVVATTINAEIFEEKYLNKKYIVYSNFGQNYQFNIVGMTRKNYGVETTFYLQDDTIKQLFYQTVVMQAVERKLYFMYSEIDYRNYFEVFDMYILEGKELENNSIGLSKKLFDYYVSKGFRKADVLNIYFNEAKVNSTVIESDENAVYFSTDLYDSLNLDPKQASLTMKDYNNLNKTMKTLEEMGYYSVSPYDITPQVDFMEIFIYVIFFGISCGINLLMIYLVGYLVIKQILLSKKKDYTIFRSMGVNSKTIMLMSKIEILSCFLIAFILVIITFFVTRSSITESEISRFLYEMRFRDFIVIGIINLILSLLVSSRYNKLLMKKSLLVNLKQN